jgi:tetratricopeptide (TPR) repeat protein
VLLAVLSGASGELGSQLWAGMTALVRRPFRHRTAAAKTAEGSAGPAGPDGLAELAALELAPADRGRALALAEALIGRAGADAEFRAMLAAWWEQAGPVRNQISGGVFYGQVLQAQTINQTIQQAAPASAPVSLAQLPAPVTGFTGRDEELAALGRLLDPAADAGPVVVSAVAGLAGVGKTTLAVQAGHTARGCGWFGGGTLFIDLHGYDDAPVQPEQALDGLLRGLGVAAEHIPPGAEARAALYRSALASMPGPVLVIADNASSETQVKPLLPGGGPHKVLVTSRHTLAGLDARLLDLTVLADADAVALLDTALRAARPGDARVAADGVAARRLTQICGGLPLALQITASLLKADPALTATELADELAVEHDRLDQLRYDDGNGLGAGSVAAAFELSYRRLSETSARVFRLLAVCPGSDVCTPATAVLVDLPTGDVRRLLAGLARAHLIEPAPSAGRWRMHDLMHLYVERLSDTHADTDGREQARDRLLDYYLTMADAADDHLRALPGVPVSSTFTSRAEALAWLDAERANLVAAVQMAADTGRDRAAMRLPILLVEYYAWRRRFDDWLMTTTISLGTARRLGDRLFEGNALEGYGLALVEVRRFGEAIAAHQDAAAIFRETGDWLREGMALNNLGLALREVRRFDEAITAHQDAAAIYRETGNRHSEGTALNNLGLALHRVRRFDEAAAAYQQDVAICRETGDRYGEGLTLLNLGAVLAEMDRFEGAVAAYRDAAAIFRETGDPDDERNALDGIESVRARQQAGSAERPA